MIELVMLSREDRLQEAAERYKQNIENWKQLYQSKIDCDFLDEDGYPTDDALFLIEQWHFSDPKGWFDFIGSLWTYKDWGWKECVGGIDKWTNKPLDDNTVRYHISTAGWSGNESIINAMQKNDWMWFLQWVQSRRGGHYIFELKIIE